MSQTAAKPHVFSRGDRIFLVAPVSPIKPEDAEIEQYAFAQDLKKMAPNPNLLWLRGNYVEADNPNSNGDEWTAEELSIKSLTPMFCPVTVMHDPSTAVGLIADTALKTPNADKVPRSRIETTLAIWSHRFPDIADEVMHNYEAGSLMQSMECLAPNYSCGECGQMFQRLPNGAESKGWCEHLAENPNARRTLSGVTFTGTGLIFGSRGARGAYSEAQLEPGIQAEIVEAHDKSHEKTTSTSRTSQRRVIPMDKMEIERSEYDSLKARPSQDDFTAAEKARDEAQEKVAKAEKAVEEAETAQKKAEKERDELKEKVEKAEQTEAADKLSKERIDDLGNDFLAALGEKTRERLDSQAGEMKDEEWTARLEELEELTEVKRDAASESDEDKGSKDDKGGTASTVTREQTASARGGKGSRSTTPSEPTEARRSAVVGGLTRRSGQKVGAGKDE